MLSRTWARRLAGPCSERPWAKHSTSFRRTQRCWPCAASLSEEATFRAIGSSVMSDTSGFELRLGHLYPDQLNMYGDRGNIITLRQRCAWRGVTLRHTPVDIGQALDPGAFDLLFIGGGQDKEQDEVARDLREVKAGALRDAIESDTPTLAVCGGYQLLARFYRPAEGPELEGIGIFDAWTIHKGKSV